MPHPLFDEFKDALRFGAHEYDQKLTFTDKSDHTEVKMCDEEDYESFSGKMFHYDDFNGMPLIIIFADGNDQEYRVSPVPTLIFAIMYTASI